MGAAPNRSPREEVHFPPNTPVTVALKYAQGKILSGQYGERVLFTTCDNRVFFVSPEVAGKIEEAGVNVREPFTITQHWDGGKDSPRTWEVAKIAPAVGEQRDGTFAVPKLPETTPKPPASASAPTRDGAALIDEANFLVDTFATAWDRARTKYEGRVKPEEVKALVITAYIQRNKLSSVA